MKLRRSSLSIAKKDVCLEGYCHLELKELKELKELSPTSWLGVKAICFVNPYPGIDTRHLDFSLFTFVRRCLIFTF